ncbi:MAG: hypothetical protein HC778_05645 [Chamaesiphon sp. CSU_1_12]|nr:hypothetical protein [Chamaesiphon sp. CSU_1_12]
MPSRANGNVFTLDNLIYRFPIADNLTAYVGAAITDVTYVGVDPVTPLNNHANGAVSNFAKSNPALYTQRTGAGGSLSYKLDSNVVVTAGYIAENGAAQSPTAIDTIDPNTGVVTTTGGGLTGGGRTIFAILRRGITCVSIAKRAEAVAGKGFQDENRSDSLVKTREKRL